MTFLSILKHVQVISSDSRQMRKNAQMCDRPTDRPTDRPGSGNESLIATKNSEKEKKSVILTMLDWSQAFERQSHKLGIQSFINNNVRISLIPTLISMFQGRQILVKWEKKLVKQ